MTLSGETEASGTFSLKRQSLEKEALGAVEVRGKGCWFPLRARLGGAVIWQNPE